MMATSLLYGSYISTERWLSIGWMEFLSLSDNGEFSIKCESRLISSTVLFPSNVSFVSFEKQLFFHQMGVLHLRFQRPRFLFANEKRQNLIGVRQCCAWSFAGDDIAVDGKQIDSILGNGKIFLESQ